MWFTSDLHLNHANILNFGGRPWKTLEEMNETIIGNFNSVVGTLDPVYILGDFILGKPDAPTLIELLGQMNGIKHLIPGNHDSPFKLEIYRTSNLIEVLPPLYEIKKPRRIVMCHFPLAKWHHDYDGVWMLHGHTHGHFTNTGKSMDVGIDAHPEFRPFHIDEIKMILDDKEANNHHHEQEDT